MYNISTSEYYLFLRLFSSGAWNNSHDLEIFPHTVVLYRKIKSTTWYQEFCSQLAREIVTNSVTDTVEKLKILDQPLPEYPEKIITAILTRLTEPEIENIFHLLVAYKCSLIYFEDNDTFFLCDYLMDFEPIDYGSYFPNCQPSSFVFDEYLFENLYQTYTMKVVESLNFRIHQPTWLSYIYIGSQDWFPANFDNFRFLIFIITMLNINSDQRCIALSLILLVRKNKLASWCLRQYTRQSILNIQYFLNKSNRKIWEPT